MLLKVVAQAVSAYAMSVFRLSASLCADLQKMCADFWWGFNKNGKKMH